MRLLIADDHSLFRDALVQYIMRAEPEALVELAKDYYEAENFIEESDDYDLVMLDYKMPGMHGINGLKRMRERHPNIRVALMSGIAEETVIRDALDHGAVGYFPKTLSGKSLLQAIQEVLNGKRYIPTEKESGNLMPAYYDDAEIQTAYGQGMQEAQEGFKQSIDDFKITKREKEVLSFVMKGESNKEIARELGLQEVTVKLHVRSICRKLDAKNRTQAAMRAQEIGFPAAQ